MSVCTAMDEDKDVIIVNLNRSERSEMCVRCGDLFVLRVDLERSVRAFPSFFSLASPTSSPFSFFSFGTERCGANGSTLAPSGVLRDSWLCPHFSEALIALARPLDSFASRVLSHSLRA
jgi:hypothetical protein